MSRPTDIEGDLLDRLLIIQSLLEHERRLKSIEQKLNLIIKELSILEMVFEENREGEPSLNVRSENRKNRDTRSEDFVYFQNLLKRLEKRLEIWGKVDKSEGDL